jgi:hypothetical protein
MSCIVLLQLIAVQVDSSEEMSIAAAAMLLLSL